MRVQLSITIHKLTNNNVQESLYLMASSTTYYLLCIFKIIIEPRLCFCHLSKKYLKTNTKILNIYRKYK